MSADASTISFNNCTYIKKLPYLPCHRNHCLFFHITTSDLMFLHMGLANHILFCIDFNHLLSHPRCGNCFRFNLIHRWWLLFLHLFHICLFKFCFELFAFCNIISLQFEDFSVSLISSPLISSSSLKYNRSSTITVPHFLTFVYSICIAFIVGSITAAEAIYSSSEGTC